MKWQVNILALVAAILGLVAMSSDWIYGGYSPNLDLVNSLQYSLTGDLYAGCLLFLVGVLICFLSPIGGILEVVGLVLFFNAYLPTSETYDYDPVGAYIGVASAIIALVSLVKPLVVVGCTKKSPEIVDRLLIMSPAQEQQVRQ